MRNKEEKLAKLINLKASKLLQEYQWDHLELNDQKIKKALEELNTTIKEFIEERESK